MSLELNKIYNMDCLKGIDMIPNNYIDLVVTSPPYNVGVNYDSYNDSISIADYFKFIEEVFKKIYLKLKDDGRVCINILYEVNFNERGGRILLISEYYTILKNIGYNFGGLIDLSEKAPNRVKNTAWGSWLSASAPYVYNPKECVIVFCKKNWKKLSKGESTFKSKIHFIDLIKGIWDYQADTKSLTIATYSLDLPDNCINLFSYKNDIVLDPFMGSGTTAESCLINQRNFLGFEISKNYCDIANERVKKWKNQTRLFKEKE